MSNMLEHEPAARPSGRLNGAIIGLGNVAGHGHLPGWRARADVEVVAVTDTEPARRAEWERLAPRARWFDRAEQLLVEMPLDFVDICTPPSSHAVVSRAALARGCHVLCEKPLVGSPEELRALAGLAWEKHRVLHTVHNWHHAPIVERAAALIADGAIGEPIHADWRTLRTRPAVTAGGAANWRLDPTIAGGGILSDHGWHVCYLLHRLLGDAPTALSAQLETRRHTGFPVEDTATLHLDFPRATAEVLLTWAANERCTRALLRGTDGSIELRDDTLALTRSHAVQRWTFAAGLSDGSHHPEWFGAVADRFVAEMRGGTDGANLAESFLCATVEALARRSSREGGAVLSLPPLTIAHPELLR